MGIGFVIILQLIAIFILSGIIAIVGSIITYFLSNKEKKKQKMFLAMISPFVGLYTLYFSALFGAIIISVIKNVDIGIGDAGYIPLIDKCELRFIDSPEYTYLENNGQEIISEISQIEQIDYLVLGKTKNDEYFSYDIKTNELKKYENETDLIIQNSNVKPKLIKSFDFYVEKRSDVIGFWLIVVGIISIAISATVLYLLRKLILGYLNFR